MIDHSQLGAVHITDGWKAYFGLNAYGHFHWNLKHNVGFVDPITKWHTNTIEGLWSLIRGDFRRFRGIKPDKLQLFLDEFSFRRNVSLSNDGLWAKLLLAIAKKQNCTQRHCFK